MPRELFGTSHGATVWLCTDGCGLTCATITWTLHIFAWSAVTKLVGLAHSRLPHPTALHVVCVVSFVFRVCPSLSGTSSFDDGWSRGSALAPIAMAGREETYRDGFIIVGTSAAG